MADRRPHRRSPTWAQSPSERRLQANENAKVLKRELDVELGQTLLGIPLTAAEQAEIREACKPRVRR